MTNEARPLRKATPGARVLIVLLTLYAVLHHVVSRVLLLGPHNTREDFDPDEST
jgi:hypothetical protein